MVRLLHTVVKIAVAALIVGTILAHFGITLDKLAHSYKPDPQGPQDYALREVDHVWRQGKRVF